MFSYGTTVSSTAELSLIFTRPSICTRVYFCLSIDQPLVIYRDCKSFDPIYTFTQSGLTRVSDPTSMNSSQIKCKFPLLSAAKRKTKRLRKCIQDRISHTFGKQTNGDAELQNIIIRVNYEITENGHKGPWHRFSFRHKRYHIFTKLMIFGGIWTWASTTSLLSCLR